MYLVIKTNRAIGTKKFRGTLSNVLDINKQNKNQKEHNATFPMRLCSSLLIFRKFST